MERSCPTTSSLSPPRSEVTKFVSYCFERTILSTIFSRPVSYTHLDVYKRQLFARTEDHFSSAGKRLAVYPAGKYAKGEKLRSTKSDYFYTMSHDSYKHTGVPRMTPAPDGQDVHIAFGANEYGLAVIAGWPRRFPTISSSSWRTTW